MSNPIHIAGLAGSAMNGVVKSMTEAINVKEHQKTIRLQSRMGAAVNGAECLQQVIDAYQEYQKVTEQEQTKRRSIEAWEKTTLKEIEKQREFLLNLLERSFDERAKNFRKLFELLDQSITSGRNENLSPILDTIVELAKSSPFKDLSDLSSVQAALGNPNHEWKF